MYPALIIHLFNDIITLASAHKHAHLHMVSDFPQDKLHRKINACFLLDKHVHLYFYCIIMVVYMLWAYIFSGMTLEHDLYKAFKENIDSNRKTSPQIIFSMWKNSQIFVADWWLD